jgi:hypothetical protein
MGSKIVIDFSNVKIIDHTVMEHIHHYAEDYMHEGGSLVVTGLEKFRPLSRHPLSYRVLIKEGAEERIPRSKQLKAFGKTLGFTFQETLPIPQTNFGRMTSGSLMVKYEGNVLNGVIDNHIYTISDISIIEGGNMKASIYQMTVLSISNLHLQIPIFTLEKEDLFDKLIEQRFADDIDFDSHPYFSKRYKLLGINEKAIRKFFNKNLLDFFEKHEQYNIECLGAEIIIYRPRKMATLEEVKDMINFGKALIETIENTIKTEYSTQPDPNMYSE